MHMPVAGPQSWTRRRAVAVPLPFVVGALLSREAWRRACPWLQIDTFETRNVGGDAAAVVRVAGAAVSPLIRLPLRLVLRLEPGEEAVRLWGEGEIVRGSRLHLDGEIFACPQGCRLDLTASADALPPILRPLVAAAEQRVLARAAAAVEALFREASRAAPASARLDVARAAPDVASPLPRALAG